MNKAQLVKLAAQDSGLFQKDINKALSAICDRISKALIDGDDVTLVNFGTFFTVSHRARNGNNPRTGEVIAVPSKRVVRFAPGKPLKKGVNDA